MNRPIHRVFATLLACTLVVDPSAAHAMSLRPAPVLRSQEAELSCQALASAAANFGRSHLNKRATVFVARSIWVAVAGLIALTSQGQALARSMAPAREIAWPRPLSELINVIEAHPMATFWLIVWGAMVSLLVLELVVDLFQTPKRSSLEEKKSEDVRGGMTRRTVGIIAAALVGGRSARGQSKEINASLELVERIIAQLESLEKNPALSPIEDPFQWQSWAKWGFSRADADQAALIVNNAGVHLVERAKSLGVLPAGLPYRQRIGFLARQVQAEVSTHSVKNAWTRSQRVKVFLEALFPVAFMEQLEVAKLVEASAIQPPSVLFVQPQLMEAIDVIARDDQHLAALLRKIVDALSRSYSPAPNSALSRALAESSEELAAAIEPYQYAVRIEQYRTAKSGFSAADLYKLSKVRFWQVGSFRYRIADATLVWRNSPPNSGFSNVQAYQARADLAIAQMDGALEFGKSVHKLLNTTAEKTPSYFAVKVDLAKRALDRCFKGMEEAAIERWHRMELKRHEIAHFWLRDHGDVKTASSLYKRFEGLGPDAPFAYREYTAFLATMAVSDRPVLHLMEWIGNLQNVERYIRTLTDALMKDVCFALSRQSSDFRPQLPRERMLTVEEGNDLLEGLLAFNDDTLRRVAKAIYEKEIGPSMPVPVELEGDASVSAPIEVHNVVGSGALAVIVMTAARLIGYGVAPKSAPPTFVNAAGDPSKPPRTSRKQRRRNDSTRRGFLATALGLSAAAGTAVAQPATTTRPVLKHATVPLVPEEQLRNKMVIKAKLLEALSALENFEKERPRIPYGFGYTEASFRAAVQRFRAFIEALKPEDIHYFPESSPQLIGFIPSARHMYYSPSTFNQLLLSADVTLIHEVIHFDERQRSREGILFALQRVLNAFFQGSVRPEVQKKAAELGRPLSVDEITQGRLWDLNALVANPAAYEAARQLLGLHWLKEMEAGYFETALLVAQSDGTKESWMALARELVTRSKTNEQVVALADQFVPAQITEVLAGYALAQVLGAPTMLDLLVAMRKRIDPSVTVESLSAPMTPAMRSEMANWINREIIQPALAADRQRAATSQSPAAVLAAA